MCTKCRTAPVAELATVLQSMFSNEMKIVRPTRNVSPPRDANQPDGNFSEGIDFGSRWSDAKPGSGDTGIVAERGSRIRSTGPGAGS